MIEALHGGTYNLNAGVTNNGGQGGNLGTIEAAAGGTINIAGGVPNLADATIEADGRGSEVDFSILSSFGNTVGNAGSIVAEHHGTVTFDDAQVFNAGGTIEAEHHGAIQLFDTTITGGTLETDRSGIIEAPTEHHVRGRHPCRRQFRG